MNDSQLFLFSTNVNNFDLSFESNNLSTELHTSSNQLLQNIQVNFGHITHSLDIKTTTTNFNDMYIFSKFLYTFGCVHLIILGMLLLVAMVGSLAILLAL